MNKSVSHFLCRWLTMSSKRGSKLPTGKSGSFKCTQKTAYPVRSTNDISPYAFCHKKIFHMSTLISSQGKLVTLKKLKKISSRSTLCHRKVFPISGFELGNSEFGVSKGLWFAGFVFAISVIVTVLFLTKRSLSGIRSASRQE